VGTDLEIVQFNHSKVIQGLAPDLELQSANKMRTYVEESKNDGRNPQSAQPGNLYLCTIQKQDVLKGPATWGCQKTFDPLLVQPSGS